MRLVFASANCSSGLALASLAVIEANLCVSCAQHCAYPSLICLVRAHTYNRMTITQVHGAVQHDLLTSSSAMAERPREARYIFD